MTATTAVTVPAGSRALPRPAVEPLVITGGDVVSPAGIGFAALAGALRTGLGDPPGDAPFEDRPPIPLRPVPDLPVAAHLGSKRVNHLDRTTQLALVACHRALAGLDVPLDEADRTRTGVVLGTSTGSIRSSSEFSRETLVQDRPYLVRANLFPNSVMNCCTGQVAIWNQLRGVNATIAGGRLSGLNAVRYARNAIRQGHVDRVLVGGVEELCPQSAWGWHVTGALPPGAALGEACAVFMVERPAAAGAGGRTPRAELLACEVGTGVAPSATLAGCVARAVRRSGVTAGEIRTVSFGAVGGLGRLEERGVRVALGGLPARRVRVAEVVGETFSAGVAMQLAALLADPGTGGAALITSIGPDGNAGCLVVRPAAG